MENTPTPTENQLYNYAANLLLVNKKPSSEVVDILVQNGSDETTANSIVSTLESQIADAKKKRAQKDMLYGALWCVGGIIATAANIGFIFWGAILFGAIQFFKGVINL